jgi:hypothetical protein
MVDTSPGAAVAAAAVVTEPSSGASEQTADGADDDETQQGEEEVVVMVLQETKKQVGALNVLHKYVSSLDTELRVFNITAKHRNLCLCRHDNKSALARNILQLHETGPAVLLGTRKD